MRVQFEKLSRFDRREEPCVLAVPFAQGVCSASSTVAVLDGKRRLASQCHATSCWADGSVRWMLVRFLADLPGHADKTLSLDISDSEAPVPSEPVQTSTDGETLVVKTGSLTAVLGPGMGLFRHLSLGAFELDEASFQGPFVYNDQREAYSLGIGPDGWHVVEDGPVCTVVEACGKHVSASEQEWMDYRVQLQFFAGKPWIQVDYKVLNKEEGERVVIGGMGVSVQPSQPAENGRYALATSNYRSSISQGEGDTVLSRMIDQEWLLYEANEQIPETHYGTFWADWLDPSCGGIAVTVHQAYQNFPKALQVGPDGVNCGLIPDTEDGVAFAQGMAKTHRLLLHLHDAAATVEEINTRSLQFQMPDQPTLKSKVYRRAEVFAGIHFPAKYPAVERVLYNLADQRSKGYGMLHWGDGPDTGYTNQGRGRGEVVWTNNEYDLPHAAMLMYAHTGARRMLDYLFAAARHWMDVDVCHHSDDPFRHQGQIIHSAGHVSEGVTVSHEWVEGLLHYYHQTGDRFAYDTAVGIGGNVLRHLEKPALRKLAGAQARETGWALRTLMALYQETHDSKWLTPADHIVEQFRAWQQEHGAWVAPYTDHTLVRVPFMMAIAANSLMRYYQVKPSDVVGRMIVDAMQDMIENCILPDGRFYYKELPSLQKGTDLVIVLESLAYAFQISRDKAFLEAGLPLLQAQIDRGADGGSGTKHAAGDAVILSNGPGPKSFAMNAPPIMIFTEALHKAGMAERIQ